MGLCIPVVEDVFWVNFHRCACGLRDCFKGINGDRGVEGIRSQSEGLSLCWGFFWGEIKGLSRFGTEKGSTGQVSC